MSLFPCTKNTLITVCVYVRSANSILRVCILWKQVAYAYQKNLSMPATFKRQLFAPFSYTETSCLRGSQTCMHERFHWSQTQIHNYTSLSLLARRVVKSLPNISSRSFHCALWAALLSQGQVARWQKIFGKKLER